MSTYSQFIGGGAGISGYSGYSGVSGFSGTSGYSGVSGYSGAAGSGASSATPTTLGTVFGYTTGNGNTSIGCAAGNTTQTGGNNIAIGCYALCGNTAGCSNIAQGQSALRINTTGTNNVAQGYQALYFNTTGINNVAIGYTALYCNTAGQHNTAIGYTALMVNTTGCNNIAVGFQSMICNTIGCNNIALGQFSLRGNTTGNGNIAQGYHALQCNTTGSNNIALGHNSLGNNSGNSNIGHGSCAGCLITTGANNTIIGSLTGSAGLVCTVLIGAGTCERVKVDNNGLCVNGALLTGNSLTESYVGFGSASNTLTGSNLFTWTNSISTLTVGAYGNVATIKQRDVNGLQPAQLIISGGNATGGNTNGGAITIQGGAGFRTSINTSGGLVSILGAPSTFTQINGGNVLVSGGTNTNSSNGIAGNLTLQGGDATANTVSTGGNLTLQGGRGGATGTGGYIVFNTASPNSLTERFRILANGAWSVGSTGTATGTSGQVLTSNGSGSAPTWQAVTATASLTSTQVGFGNGSNALTGSTKFIWSDTATSLFIGLTGTAGTISAPTSSTTPATLTIKGGNTTTVSQTGGAVQVIGGSSTLGAVGGEVIIKGGAATTGNFNGGAISIIGGASNGQAVGGSVTISAAPYVTGNTSGGNISITAGTAGGTGTPGTVTITGGTVSTNTTSRTSAWTNVNMTGGTFDPASFTTTFAADVRISGGSLSGSTGVSTEVYTTGSVYISGGVGGGHVNQAGGAVIFSTAPGTTLIERFRILNNGAWSVGSTGTATGTSGQVLTSNGSGSAPTWQTVSAATATNLAGGLINQIPYQTAASTTAFSSDFTWSQSSKTLTLSGSTQGGTVTITTGAGGTPRSLVVEGGGGNQGNDGSSVTIKGGGGGGGTGSAGGAATVSGGDALFGNFAGGTLTLRGGTSSAGTGGPIIFQTAATNTLATAMTISKDRNVSIGLASPATSATDGFVQIPVMAGTPSGTPTVVTGFAPMVVDSSGTKLWIYIGGAWKSVALI